MGRQARTRRQIDPVEAEGVPPTNNERDALPPDHSKRLWFNEKLALLASRNGSVLAQI